jgi:PKHD-type hydroxylase
VYDSGDKGVYAEPELIYKFMRINPNLHEWYKFSAGFLPEECDKILHRFKNQELMKASVGDGVLGVVDENIRRSDVCWIPKNKQNDWIYSRILNLVAEANRTFFNFDLIEISEKLQFTRYNVGDKYDWHIDFGGKEFQGLRKLSLVVQLSDPCDYEGGELQFGSSTDDTIEIAPKNKGAVIVFPSYLRHRATEVTKGSRYSLVLWVTGPPFR